LSGQSPWQVALAGLALAGLALSGLALAGLALAGHDLPRIAKNRARRGSWQEFSQKPGRLKEVYAL